MFSDSSGSGHQTVALVLGRRPEKGVRKDPSRRNRCFLTCLLVKSSLLPPENRDEANGKARCCQTVGNFFCVFFFLFLSKRGNNVCRAAVVHSGSVRKSGAGYLEDRYFYFTLFSENRSMQENIFLAKNAKLEFTYS